MISKLRHLIALLRESSILICVTKESEWDELLDKLGVDSRGAMIRAVETLKFLVKLERGGSRLIIRHRDGSEESLTILGAG